MAAWVGRSGIGRTLTPLAGVLPPAPRRLAGWIDRQASSAIARSLTSARPIRRASRQNWPPRYVPRLRAAAHAHSVRISLSYVGKIEQLADPAGGRRRRAGSPSPRHVVEIRPSFLKLDIRLVRRISVEQARSAFVAGPQITRSRWGAHSSARGSTSRPGPLGTERRRTSRHSPGRAGSPIDHCAQGADTTLASDDRAA